MFNHIISTSDVLFLGKLYKVIEYSKSIKWYYNDNLHREGDKPAVVHKNGNSEWYIKGLRHRDNDKPAIIRQGNSKEWYLNGVRHRSFAKPAVIFGERIEYFEFGKRLEDKEVKIRGVIHTF
jgi:hypothetical protein